MVPLWRCPVVEAVDTVHRRTAGRQEAHGWRCWRGGRYPERPQWAGGRSCPSAGCGRWGTGCRYPDWPPLGSSAVRPSVPVTGGPEPPTVRYNTQNKLNGGPFQCHCVSIAVFPWQFPLTSIKYICYLQVFPLNGFMAVILVRSGSARCLVRGGTKHLAPPNSYLSCYNCCYCFFFIG